MFFLTSNAFSQERLYPPTVEISDNSLWKFLTELTLAVGKRDEAFITNHLSPKIINSFGGNGGIDEFLAKWKLGDKDSRFWGIVERLLTLGGSKYIENSNTYSIPYIYTDWNKLENNYDGFFHSLIVGNNVNVRDAPNIRTSKVLGQFSHEVVKLPANKSFETRDQHQHIDPNPMGGYSWQYVCSLNDELCGFVYWKYVVSPIGYRMGFEKINGKWLIIFLVAGD